MASCLIYWAVDHGGERKTYTCVSLFHKQCVCT